MTLTTLLALNATAKTSLDRIVIISDMHIVAPELVTPGSAIDKADAGDTKMMAMSDDIMTAITDSIIAIKPTLVLLTGDLTHNGERLSHERMAKHLDRMAQHGIQSLVIPGNHDISNPYARSFDADKTRPAATITREEFAQIYAPYGYDSKSQRDPNSLSYCCEPIKDVVVIGIDSNMDELNTLVSRGDSTDTYHNAGRVKPETLQWVVDRARAARLQGKRVIAMMHHHLVPHFDKEEQLLANYIIKDNTRIAQEFIQAGIHTIFTGHLHVTDAATVFNKERTDSIVEIATGSAICYPFALRTATFDRKHHSLDIDTRWMTNTDKCPNLREQGRQRIINATPGLANMISNRAWNRFGNHMDQLKKMLEMNGQAVNLPANAQQASQLAMRHLSEVLSRTLLAVVEGNEQEKDPEAIIEQGKQGVRAMIAEVAPQLADNLWEFFEQSIYPRLEPLVNSVLQDRNAVGTDHESHTDDLHLNVKL